MSSVVLACVSHVAARGTANGFHCHAMFSLGSSSFMWYDRCGSKLDSLFKLLVHMLDEGRRNVVGTASPDEEDADLCMAIRESQLHAISIRNEAYRQALGEVAGELYLEVYKSSLQRKLLSSRNLWQLEDK